MTSKSLMYIPLKDCAFACWANTNRSASRRMVFIIFTLLFMSGGYAQCIFFRRQETGNRLQALHCKVFGKMIQCLIQNPHRKPFSKNQMGYAFNLTVGVEPLHSP